MSRAIEAKAKRQPQPAEKVKSEHESSMQLKDQSGNKITVIEFLPPVHSLTDTTGKLDLGILQVNSLTVTEPMLKPKKTQIPSRPCCKPEGPKRPPRNPGKDPARPTQFEPECKLSTKPPQCPKPSN